MWLALPTKLRLAHIHSSRKSFHEDLLPFRKTSIHQAQERTFPELLKLLSNYYLRIFLASHENEANRWRYDIISAYPLQYSAFNQ